MASDVQGIVGGGLGRGKSMRRFPTLEALHFWLFDDSADANSRRDCSPTGRFDGSFDAEFSDGAGVRGQFIRPQPIGVFLQKLAREFECGRLVSLRLDQNVEEFTC